MLRIIATVTNDLTFDQRMQRICATLTEAGYEVLLVGRLRPQSKPLKPQPFRQLRLRCWNDKGKWFYIEYNIRLFCFLLVRRFDVVNAVDLDTILAGFWAARCRGKTCVYDAHEYFTEVPEVVNRPRIQRIWQKIADHTIPQLKYCYTVGAALAEIFRKEYGPEFGVVRNLPFSQYEAIPSSNFEKKIILYQGALNVGRGLECAILAMQHLPEAELWLAGEGDLSAELRTMVRENELEERVRFLGYVQPTELKEITLKASLGLNLLENIGKSYYYSLANKAFDYIQAGLPSVQMTFPEYKVLQEQFGPFVLLEEEKLKPEQLAKTISNLFQDKEQYLKLRQNCLDARKTLCWEQEKETLITIYDHIKA